MLLQKTEKARLELWPGAGAGSVVRTLGRRERSVLLLATGDKSIFDFREMFGGRGEEIALNLLQQGYLEITRTTRPDSISERLAKLLSSENAD